MPFKKIAAKKKKIAAIILLAIVSESASSPHTLDIEKWKVISNFNLHFSIKWGWTFSHIFENSITFSMNYVYSCALTIFLLGRWSFFFIFKNCFYSQEIRLLLYILQSFVFSTSHLCTYDFVQSIFPPWRNFKCFWG